jgi:serine/threonine protein kinase
MNAPLLPSLPGYDNPELIAHGTTALVFRAIQTTLNRPVAIKVITVDTGSIPVNAARELATTVALSSQPHIVSIIDTGVTEDDRPYIVMEYCEGGSYAGILRQHGPLPLADVLEVGVKIGEALHAAHQAGIVHRDVKPSNILRSRFGPALTDFGIARAPDELGNTLTRELMTPHHASPEALLHQAQSGISDVYSLASTMWTLLVGHPPFVDPRNPMMDMYAFRDRVLHDDLPPMPRDDVPPWLLAELRKAMSKLPAARHRSALDFAESLQRGSLGLDPSSGAVPAAAPVSAAPSSPAPTRLIDAANAAGSLSLGLPSALGQPATFVPPPESSVPTPYLPPAGPLPPAAAAIGSAAVSVPPAPVPPAPAPAQVPPAPAQASTMDSTPSTVEEASGIRPWTPAPTEAPAAGPWSSAPTRDQATPEPRETGGAITGGSTGRSANPMRAPVIPPLPSGAAAPMTRPAPPQPPLPPPPPRPGPQRPPVPMPPVQVPPERPQPPGAGTSPPSWPGPTSALAVPVPVEPPAEELVGGWPPPPPGRPGSSGEQRDDGGWLGASAPATPRTRPAPARLDRPPLVAPPKSRGTLVAVLIVAAVIAIVGAGILVALNRGRGNGVVAGGPEPTATPQATHFITASTQDAPKNVKIIDQRGTTLTVTWTDPTNGTVPFVVNGVGPNDEKLDPKYLDRGITTVTFVGLSPTRNYCFLVAAVYSTTHVAVAEQTCTRR